MMASPTIDRLYRLAACLQRPVARGWLSPTVAEAILVVSVFNGDLVGLDAVAVAAELRATLWRTPE
jgi:hypothetical protein